MIRTPTLPFTTLEDWGACTDRDGSRAFLAQTIRDPVVREAIFIASPSLESTIDAWLAAPDSPAGQATERGLVRYVSRMCGRATPFGLCSAVGSGTVGAETRLAVTGLGEYRRHVRIDNDYLFELCAHLAADPALRALQRYTPNSSLYTAAARLRYVEARLVANLRSYHLVAVDPSDYLDRVLARARDGATLDELAAILCEDPDVTREEALAFLDELVATQLLVSPLQPVVTGREPALPLAEILDGLPPATEYAAALRDAVHALEAIDRAPLGVPATAYQAIADLLTARLPTPAEPHRAFQVDLFRVSDTLALGPKVTAEIARAAALLYRIGGAAEDDRFTRFKSAFSARYETREVPLLELLDDDAGIGLGEDRAAAVAPLLADVAFAGRSDPRRVPWGKREIWMLHAIARAERTGEHELVLTDEDLESLGGPPERPPPVFTVTGAVAASSSDALAAGDFTFRLDGIDLGVRMFGRFCHGSESIAKLTRDMLAAEEATRPDAIYAEIVHLPGGRIGNILLRPILRSYEIEFLGSSGAPRSHRISVDDLMVSVRENRVVLRSRRLDREVIPRLTTAHNFSTGLVVYKFLCALAEQYGTGVRWQWGPFSDAPFVPRLRHGRTVISRARWLLDPHDLEPIVAAAKGSASAKITELAALRERQHGAIAALRARRRLPRWIAVARGDNELVVDLDNPLMVDSLVHLMKTRTSVSIFELYPAVAEQAVRAGSARYVHELQLPLVTTTPSITPKVFATPASVARRFPPGSEWLYLKIYTGPATLEVVLRELAPMIHAVIDEGLAERWFFLRYGDPDWHLRLRFLGDAATLTTHVLPRAHAALAPLLEAKLVWRIVVDTYEREVERYGGPDAIDYAEQIFHHDSDAVLAIVERAGGGDAALDASWRLAVRGIDELLDDLGLDLDAKLRLMTRARDAFGSEVGLDTEGQRRLGVKFREHQAELSELLGAPPRPHPDDEHPWSPGLDAFARRAQRLIEPVARLRVLARDGRLAEPLEILAQSFVHMHVNRMLASAHRAQEVVLYDLLRRLYAGMRARRSS